MIVIVGPTGIGKTALSIALAKHYHTEIISGDSVQVYKGLNIGSAKVTTDEMQGIKHHLIDIFEPTEDFSVALYQQLVRDKIKELEDQSLVPIIVGGTGLYIKSVLYNYNFNDTLRDKEKESKLEAFSNAELHSMLQEKDPVSAENIHFNNRKRVLQALLRSDSNKVSDNTLKDQKVYDFTLIGLTLPREELYTIINNRGDQMIEDGVIEEVQELYNQNIQGNSVQAIGYKELYKYFDGEWTKEQAIDKIKQHSRNLAKKQFTFFNNQFEPIWVTINKDNFDQTIEEVIQILETKVNL